MFGKLIQAACVAAIGQGLLSALPTSAYAVPITSNPTLAINGMTFSTFDVHLTHSGVLSFPLKAKEIDVSLIGTPGATGIQISSGFIVLGNGFDDAAITYTATSDTGIQNVGLSFNGSFFGLAITSVTENVYSDVNHTHLAGKARVSCGAFVGCHQTDTIVLDGIYSTVYITKDISVATAFGLAETSIIDQTFMQVPEPASMAVLGAGLTTLGLIRRRRAQLGLRGTFVPLSMSPLAL